MNAVADVLRRARARIEDPAKWYQGSYRDATDAGSDDCAVCAVGAVSWAVSGIPGASGHRVAVSAVRLLDLVVGGVAYGGFIYGGDIAKWQDSAARAHADVLAAFDRAIALAEASQ